MTSPLPCLVRGRFGLLMVFVAMVCASDGRAGTDEDRPAELYQMPPQVLAGLVDAPVTPFLSLNPGGDTILVGKRSGLLTIADLSQPELKLAGLRFNPTNRSPGRAPYLKTLAFVDVAAHRERPIAGLPDGAHIRGPSWSPDGSHVAFSHATTSELQLWVVDVAAARARQLPVRLNGAMSSMYDWLDDSKTLVCAVVPEKQGPPPVPSAVPSGPSIQESVPGKKAPVRTYQDLIKNADDEKLFDHYMSSEIVAVTVDGARKRLAGPELVVTFDPSPDGRFLLVETVHRPFSRIVPVGLFPLKSEVLDREGKPVTVVADLPAAENVPPDFDAVRQGRRDISWRSDAAATLYWVEAQDEGDPKKTASVRDKVFVLEAPFDKTPVCLASLELRFSGMDWASNDLALVSEYWWKTRKTRTHRIAPARPGEGQTVIFDRSSEDRYSDPGQPAERRLPNGRRVMIVSGSNTVYLVGEGASPEGDRPFLDRFDLAANKATRLWRSEAPWFERPIRLLDDAGKTVLTLREAIEESPNVFRRDLGKPAAEQLSQVTQFPHPAPQLKGVKKELIRYKRADGVDLTGTLYTPPGFTPRKDKPLPALMWAYPAEFKSASAAGQVTDSPYRFVGPAWSGPLFWVLMGYAILDDPTFPIVGEGKVEPNDTYVKQLVMGATAAVEELARRGVGDPARMAIGGHSYGAFTTANLLAHSDLFRAGIARSGAYNRTLTPFGFQSEERTFWEAKDTYVEMSPFTVADRIDEPLLMIHGIDDQNSGTFPIQSERMLHAIKGLGGTARLVLLPKEGHGYQSRESAMHVVWEMNRWLEMYVKKAPERAAKPAKKQEKKPARKTRARR